MKRVFPVSDIFEKQLTFSFRRLLKNKTGAETAPQHQGKELKMILLSSVFVIICLAALFGGLINATGRVVIALLKYVIAPVAALIAVLGIIKYGF